MKVLEMLRNIFRTIFQSYQIFLLVILVFQFSVAGCKKDSQVNKESKQFSNEDLVKVNKYLVEKDQKKIETYVQRHQLIMQHTPSGLWYQVIENSSGKTPVVKARKGLYALIWYRSSLLDGTACYSSEESGPMQFQIGHGGVESGLEEGIMLLQTGDSARFIIPPHLAFGLTGDQKRIPGRSILIYEFRLLRLGESPVHISNSL